MDLTLWFAMLMVLIRVDLKEHYVKQEQLWVWVIQIITIEL